MLSSIFNGEFKEFIVWIVIGGLRFFGVEQTTAEDIDISPVAVVEAEVVVAAIEKAIEEFHS